MSRYVRYKNAENEIKWGLVGNDGNFLEIEGDRFTQYNITDKVVEADSVRILPPSDPSKIVCVGLNYADHAAEMGLAAPEEPVIFIKPATTVIAHGEKIKIPPQSSQVEFEAELAIVIKNEIKDIDEDEVMDNILGFTCFNDVTARDLQKKDGQWTRAKSFDTFGPVGPFVRKNVDPDNLDICLSVNGEIKQHSNTSQFIFKTKKLVSFISSVMTLYRGDIISTGTPAGISALKKGDVVEVEIEGIGKLTNFVE
ncbi:MAG TPA: fumarylacetoacetate hydrolase family protein [Candidatus Goldiibacteriota bacterium]|nr:fumarylacetoacetate hydrolase family protein [Candidatus Goldiibacteriota bacterium]HRQ43882.1 fumarylacetoacetate hydrolase family protein [Candidatus Goldiibacteriota bacterium]